MCENTEYIKSLERQIELYEKIVKILDTNIETYKKLSEAYLDEAMFYKGKMKGYQSIIDEKNRTIEHLTYLTKNEGKDNE